MSFADLQQKRIFKLTQLTMQEWFADNTPRHAAALAYYTIFALSPLLTIVLAIATAIYGYQDAEATIMALADSYVHHPGVVELIQTVLTSSRDTSANPLLTLISIGALLYGATNVFSELQSALNVIWDAPIKNSLEIKDVFLNRLFAVVMVFSGGLLLFASLIVASIIAAANQWANAYLHVTIYSEWIVFFSLFGLSTLIFALIYKFVPNVQVAWDDVFIGAVTTGLLFTIARALIIWWLGYMSIPSIFGATGSLVALLVWIYYSALIFFLGAEFTQVYGRTYGSRWREQELLKEADAEEKRPTIETPEGVIVKESPVENAQPDGSAIPIRPPAVRKIPVENLTDGVAEIEIVNETDGASSEPVAQRSISSVRTQVQRGLRKTGQGLNSLRKASGPVTSRFGDIAIGVAVVGAISIAGLFWEPWRKKSQGEKTTVE
ncbi:MAG: YihY/virulence factor BrkB family protein [Caldilineaceae bacterium]|nr:YihY/virulence factor BrkB family protein [Caldilineaceae bacterium]MCB0139858.1 YihY/virulence factor BrkB family protein [Caldilineaceae bacterium]